jgi:hypothetical protein
LSRENVIQIFLTFKNFAKLGLLSATMTQAYGSAAAYQTVHRNMAESNVNGYWSWLRVLR